MSYSTVTFVPQAPVAGLGKIDPFVGHDGLGGSVGPVEALLLIASFGSLIGAAIGAVMFPKNRVAGGVGGAIALPVLLYSAARVFDRYEARPVPVRGTGS